MKQLKQIKLLIILLLMIFTLTGCTLEINTNSENTITIHTNTTNTAQNIVNAQKEDNKQNVEVETDSTFDLSKIPSYMENPYVVVNDNKPFFEDKDFTNESFESYSELDSLNRCGVAIANIGKDLMPTDERESIGSIKPSGWQTVRYESVDGKYLYNRCHLIGFQLTGENSNKENLITGTRYLNVQGMLPFENMVADYIKETNNHVLYRVTPIFENDNLVASGVLMEAKSYEDNGEGIEFNVYCYNVQPNIKINYKTGESSSVNNTNEIIEEEVKTKYVLNTSSKKIHLPECSNAKDIKEKNKREVFEAKVVLIKQGYEPCGSCKP